MENKLAKEIGMKIKELRGKKSLRQLGASLDVDPSYISKIENGRMPSMKMLDQLAEYFGVDVSYFFGEKQQLPTELEAYGVEWVTFIQDMKGQDLTPEKIKNIIKVAKAFKNNL